MIDLELLVKEVLALKAGQEDLTKRVRMLEDELIDRYAAVVRVMSYKDE